MAVKTKRRAKKDIPVLKKSTKTGRVIPKETVEVVKPPAIGTVVERVPKTPPAERPAKQHEPETLKLPNLDDFPVNLVELPRAIVKTTAEDFFYQQIGETDKAKIIALHGLFKKGWKVHSVTSTDRNTFLFVLVK